MTYEIELKFPHNDLAAVKDELAVVGAKMWGVQRQSDQYFNHPSRDFAETNEAFRIRSIGDRNFLTYKGPVIDRETKMRRELEIPCGDGDVAASQLAEMWGLLGFRAVLQVRKTRTCYALMRKDRQFEIALDEVDRLGVFIEIETLAEEADREVARDAVLELARELNLSNPERRSYLELLLEQAGEA